MRTLACLVATVGLLASLGCERTLLQGRRTQYVPWEEGLTLIYEDPTLPPSQRFQERLQRRVSASKEIAQGRRVTITYSTLKNNLAVDFFTKDGSWAMLQGNDILMRWLPEGFPDRVDHWVDQGRGITFRVLGRGTVPNPDLKLPADFDRIGIWVEMESRLGPKRRILFLPNIGEAETLVLNRTGQWVKVSQLVSRGFTDLPTPSEDKKP